MKLPLRGLITTVRDVRQQASVQLHDAWKIGTPEFSKLNYNNVNKEAYKKNALVYACVREIATSVADARFQVIVREADGVISPVPDHPTQRILENPNPVMSPMEFWESLLTIEHIAGNAYVLKDLDEENLWILRPDWVRIVQLGGGRREYKYGPPGSIVTLSEDQVIHFPYGVDPQDIYGFGFSPLAPIWRDVSTDNSATDFFKVFFDNSAVPSGIIKVKRRLARQGEANRIRSQWSQRYTGPKGWHAPAVLDEDAEYQKIGLDLQELRMDSLRHVVESRLCMAFGVPPIIVGANVGLQRSTYSNYKEAKASFWEETLAPMYRRHAQIIRRGLLSEFPMAERFDTRFDLSDVAAMQQQRMDQAEAYTPALQHGGLTVNQFLTLLGMNPVPGGDRYVGGEAAEDANRSHPSYHRILLDNIATQVPELADTLRFADKEQEVTV